MINFLLLSAEDFQIDEFAVHDGQWDEKVYTADCTVLDEVN